MALLDRRPTGLSRWQLDDEVLGEFGVQEPKDTEELKLYERERAETIVTFLPGNKIWRWHQCIDRAWPTGMRCQFCQNLSREGDVVLARIIKATSGTGIPLDVTILFHKECMMDAISIAPDCTFEQDRARLLAGEDIFGISG